MIFVSLIFQRADPNAFFHLRLRTPAPIHHARGFIWRILTIDKTCTYKRNTNWAGWLTNGPRSMRGVVFGCEKLRSPMHNPPGAQRFSFRTNPNRSENAIEIGGFQRSLIHKTIRHRHDLAIHLRGRADVFSDHGAQRAEQLWMRRLEYLGAAVRGGVNHHN